MRQGAHAAVRLGLEGAKTALRTALYRFNIDLGRDPYQVRVARTLAWIGADGELIDVVAAGDVDEALRVLESHLNHVRDGVIALLEAAAIEAAGDGA